VKPRLCAVLTGCQAGQPIVSAGRSMHSPGECSCSVLKLHIPSKSTQPCSSDCLYARDVRDELPNSLNWHAACAAAGPAAGEAWAVELGQAGAVTQNEGLSVHHTYVRYKQVQLSHKTQPPGVLSSRCPAASTSAVRIIIGPWCNAGSLVYPSPNLA
jgi:hypothetical protein